MTKKELWQSILAKLQSQMSPANFSTWFSNTSVAETQNDLLEIYVPNNFVKEWVENRYYNQILKILREINSGISQVKFIVGRVNTNIKERTIRSSKKNKLIEENQLTLQNISIDPKTNLNKKYSFENFVVGPFNQLAHACCVSIIQNPSSSYNPLFIYGNVGLGKTHLLQATGNEILKRYKNLKVKYIQCERLISLIINSIKNQNIEEMKNSLLELDVFIIDDVQFLSGKEKTQEEFFHLFNFLYERNKQIIISSDRPPKDLSIIEERLKSRFEGGMVVDISMPDLETRIAILKTKCKERGIELSDGVLEYIAENIKTNIRKLEGAIIKIAGYKQIYSENITIEKVKDILKSYIDHNGKATLEKIIKVTAEMYDVKESDILSNTRKKEIVKPRQIVMFLLREELKMSYPLIGRKLNGKDHTTVMHACKKIEDELKVNKDLYEEIELIRQRIYC
ncbi:Chromosomal replication initiator protein DnaA [bacterium HR34]|nr:Chromosomal replication initiator protein DnaA [bacterium HR34]